MKAARAPRWSANLGTQAGDSPGAGPPPPTLGPATGRPAGGGAGSSRGLGETGPTRPQARPCQRSLQSLRRVARAARASLSHTCRTWVPPAAAAPQRWSVGIRSPQSPGPDSGIGTETQGRGRPQDRAEGTQPGRAPGAKGRPPSPSAPGLGDRAALRPCPSLESPHHDWLTPLDTPSPCPSGGRSVARAQDVPVWAPALPSTVCLLRPLTAAK